MRFGGCTLCTKKRPKTLKKIPKKNQKVWALTPCDCSPGPQVSVTTSPSQRGEAAVRGYLCLGGEFGKTGPVLLRSSGEKVCRRAASSAVSWRLAHCGTDLRHSWLLQAPGSSQLGLAAAGPWVLPLGVNLAGACLQPLCNRWSLQRMAWWLSLQKCDLPAAHQESTVTASLLCQHAAVR